MAEGKKTGSFLSRLVESVANQNYHSARSHYHWQLGRRDRRQKGAPIVVYQMGKVGSSTIKKSLHSLDVGRPVYHVHFLTQSLIDFYEGKRKKLFGTDRVSDLKHIWQYQYLSKQLAKGGLSDKWKVVTLVREPISRNLSAFLETVDVEATDDGRYRLKADTKSAYEFDVTVGLEDVEQLVQIFLKEFEHDVPLKFFDEQIKTVLGIDVFESEFPKDKGYKIYEGETAELLVLKLEKLEECVGDAFREFLGAEDFTLQNTNVASKKVYAPIYKELKEKIVLPHEYIDTMYDSRFMQYFYTDDEIKAFDARWRRNAG